MTPRRLPLDLAVVQRNLEALTRILSERAVSRGFPPPRVVVVSKYLTAEDARRLRGSGISPLGENRASDLIEKCTPEETDGWHFIGHLQRNKISKVIPRISLLHSLDSERLAQAIEEWAQRQSTTVRCLVQVNVAGEEQKGGLTPTQARKCIPQWSARFPHLRLQGLMTMAPHVDSEACRPVFAELRELRDEIGATLQDSNFCELSMGMSNDAEVAAEEGATWIRVGSRLFESNGPRPL